jgi:hydrogenase maturation protease
VTAVCEAPRHAAASAADGRPPAVDGRRLTAELTVVGIGNVLAGDDGAGVLLADALETAGLPPGARVRQAGSDPLAVLEELEAGRQVLLLDACRFGGRPGALTWMRLDDPRWPAAAAPLSLHGLDLPTVFQLARTLHLPLEKAWLLGVQPAATLGGRGLSPAVANAWPHLVDGAHRAVRRLLDGLAPADSAPANAAGAGAASPGA